MKFTYLHYFVNLLVILMTKLLDESFIVALTVCIITLLYSKSLLNSLFQDFYGNKKHLDLSDFFFSLKNTYLEAHVLLLTVDNFYNINF